MSAFLAILGFLIVLDLAWWRLSHRWLRGKPRWRLFNTVFILVQILGFGFLIGGRIAGVRWNLPTPYLGSIYLWHLFILPLLLVGVIFVPLWLVNRFARSRTKND